MTYDPVQREKEYQTQHAISTSGLAAAIATGNVAKAGDIVEADPAVLYDHDSGGDTPLMLAVRRGVPPDVRNHLGETALKAARQMGHEETARVLKEHGVPE
ncbi:MAG: hypothetical protein WBD05_03050 [Phycisphaerae bacterium]